ncbi:MAG TPA: hypothetical protein VGL38_05895 [bacterium]|jgi:hypothetical protein
MENILDLKVGTMSRAGVVLEVSVEQRRDGAGKLSPKVILTVEGEDKLKYIVDSAWVERSGKGSESRGLWLRRDFNGQILHTSTVAEVLRHHSVDTLGGLIGREVTLHPKHNGFLAIVVTNAEITPRKAKGVGSNPPNA